MMVRMLGRSVDLTLGKVFGLAMVAVGLILFIFAYSAHADILQIGETTDPILQARLATLEDQRDASVVSGIGFTFLGIFAVGILGERSSPRAISEDEMVSSARMAAQMIAAFSLVGNSAYLPAKHGLSKERVLVPSTKAAFTPPAALSDDLVLSPGKDGSTPGMVLEPLGLALTNRIEKELGVSLNGVGLEAAEGTLQILKHGLGMIKDFHFKEREGKWVLRVEYKGLRDACGLVRKEMPDTCRQMACIGCACLLTAAARATGKLVVVDEVDNSQDQVLFTLSMREW